MGRSHFRRGSMGKGPEVKRMLVLENVKGLQGNRRAGNMGRAVR
jgi:hypothetical protein